MDAFTWILLILVPLMLGLKIVGGYRYLREEGRPIRPTIPADALFGEARASGNSEASVVTKFAGASNALLVSITRTELAVQSRFPMNVFMPVNSFEFHTPIDRISSAYQVDTRSVRVTFTDDEERSRVVRLYLQNPEKFASVMSSLGVPNAA